MKIDRPDNGLKETMIASSTGDENLAGNKPVLSDGGSADNKPGIIKHLFRLVLGIILIIGLSRFAQRYSNLDVDLIAALVIAGLYCYLLNGPIGPITCTLGYCISHYLDGDLEVFYIFAIILFVSTVLLRLLVKPAKRYENKIVKFSMCATANIISVFIFYMITSYLRSYLTGIPLVFHQAYIIKPLFISLIGMELCLLVSMLAERNN